MERFLRLVEELGWDWTQTAEECSYEFFYTKGMTNDEMPYDFEISYGIDTKDGILEELKKQITNKSGEERRKIEEVYNLSSRLLK